ncbi:MAG: helix-turn-helix transcriptional regulator [Acholeplasmatales bacterium]|nr:helix-turn-helix transcriptional regulator [Acholeplasmatales bacterium]
MRKTIETSKIAKNIKSVRLSNKLTQFEMADILGYSERQIRRLEANGTSDINVINLIATKFDVSALDILSSDGMF